MIKIKYRYRLDTESQLGLKLPKITTKIDSIYDLKQAYHINIKYIFLLALYFLPIIEIKPVFPSTFNVFILF